MATLALDAPRQKPLPLPLALLVSIGIHVVLIAGLLFSSLFAPPRLTTQETIHVKLARLGTPRDQKLLPRKQEQPTAPPAPPVQVSKVVPVQSTKPTPKETNQKAPTNQDKLKTALAKLAKQVDQTGQTDGFDHGTDDQTEGELYWARVKDRILRFYTVPNTIPEGERRKLVATLEIHIAADGTITETRTDQGSGNAVFDRALESAIKKCKAFPPPPPHLAKLAREGVSLEFHAAEM